MYSVPVVVVVVVMSGSPSARIQVSYLTETCTTADTSLPTWYRTTPLTSRPAGEPRKQPRRGRGPVWCSALFDVVHPQSLSSLSYAVLPHSISGRRCASQRGSVTVMT